MKLRVTVLVALLALASSSVHAAANGAGASAATVAYVEGKDFEKVDNPGPVTAGPIVIEEFFWYGCPHCYAAEPGIARWAETKAADVELHRVPNSLGRDIGTLHGKAFFAAAMLGILEKTHQPMFEAIHVQHLPLSKPADIAALYNKVAGVPVAEVEAALSSFMVDGNMGRAESLARQYGVTSTPMLVVDGHYRIKAKPTADEMFKIADYVVGIVRKAKALGPPAPLAPAAAAPAPAAEQAAAPPAAAAAPPAPAPITPPADAPRASAIPLPLLIVGGLVIAGIVLLVIVRPKRKA